MRLYESGEMYLETILMLSKRLENVRSLDIANHLCFSKPSVSRAVGLLKKSELINVDSNGYITLTSKGTEIAESMYERHIILSTLLEKLGVSSEIAVKDACKIEHHLSEQSFEAIKRYINKI